jgi:hypothetical protein
MTVEATMDSGFGKHTQTGKICMTVKMNYHIITLAPKLLEQQSQRRPIPPLG